ncbi:MAG TPA: RluA family pseudouridine synthase [Acidimicrobiales bacterium]|nr:RluA family pseudouridine synthase [Acidimicrobiales bacterium]
MHVVIPEAVAGDRVDRVVALFTGLPRSEVADLVASGAIAVNGVIVTTRSRRVVAGETLDVTVPVVAEVVLEPDADVPFEVVHADDAVIVVDKPAGVVVHPGAGVRSATLVHGLLARFADIANHDWPDPDRPGIVHRLDKETSGLLMVARTPDVAAILVAQLQARTVDRRYLALVLGEVAHEAGIIDAPLGRSNRDRTRMTVAAGGREARTNYKVIERFTTEPPSTLVECKLDTGRTHQIRVHLAAIGHAVAGDSRYRGGRAFGLRRPFLHAYELGFDHPISGEPCAFESALPADLEGVRTKARAAQ